MRTSLYPQLTTSCVIALALYVHELADSVAVRSEFVMNFGSIPFCPGGDLFRVCDSRGQWLYRSVPLENENVPIELPDRLTQPRFENMQLNNIAASLSESSSPANPTASGSFSDGGGLKHWSDSS
jgi:hypothetical protein